MIANFKNEKTWAIAATTLFVLSLVGIMYFQSSNKSLSRMWKDEKSKNEQIQNEKQKLGTEVSGLKKEVNTLASQNAELNSSLASANSTIAERDRKIQGLSKEVIAMNSLRKKYKDSEAERASLQTQMTGLNNQVNSLRNEKDQLNKNLMAVREENKKLKETNDILTSLTAENFRIETMKRKDRLTVIAKRTRKMNVSFDVPQNVADNVRFTIVRPDGKKINSEDKSISYRIVDDSKNLTASTSNAAPVAKTKKVEMKYEPKEKLPAGVYQIEIRNGDKKINTCQVRLR